MSHRMSVPGRVHVTIIGFVTTITHEKISVLLIIPNSSDWRV